MSEPQYGRFCGGRFTETHQHQTLVEQLGNPLLVGRNSDDAVPGKRPRTVREQADRLQERADHHGLEHVELKLPLSAGDRDAHVVADDLGGDHREGLALGRVHLPRHDRRAGFVLGEREFAEAATRARTEVADVVGDLVERARDDVQGARGLDDGVVRGEGLELVRRRLKLETGDLGNLGGDGRVKALPGVEPRADGGAALSELGQAREDALDARDAVLDLLDVARELLAEGERGRVLQVGATDLDDALEGLLLLVQGGLELLEGGDERVGDLDDGRDVHRGRERVVRRLRHVDVVVRVDGLLRAELAAEDLDRAVRDDLRASCQRGVSRQTARRD